MSSLAKTLAVLDLFTGDRTFLTVDVVMERLQLSRTTAYRYLQLLSKSGLIAHFGGGYVLGPRIIELDLLIRTADPLLAIAEPIMRRLSTDYECDAQVLSLFGDRVIVTGHVSAGGELPLRYGRGRATPLFRGAGGWVIMAALPIGQVRKIMNRNNAAILNDEESIGDAATDDLATRLKHIRRQGYYISHGELDPEVVAIAAPVQHQCLDAPASLALVFRRRHFALTDQIKVVGLVQNAAAKIIGQLDIAATSTV